MSKHEFDPGDSRRFTLTIFLSFAVVFVFVVLMMRCHGDFNTGTHAEEGVPAQDASHH